MPERFFVGVDGGGTRSTAILVSESGSILNVKRGDGLNYHTIGMESARNHLLSLINDLLKGNCQNAIVSIGLSSLDDIATEEQVAAFIGDSLPHDNVFLHSDAYMALMAATFGEKGAITIAGTGSMIVRVDENGVQKPAGGWGYILGDEGSSYSIALNGMRSAIREWEGTGIATSLSSALMKVYRLSSPRQLIDRVYDPKTKPSDIAGFAKYVLIEAANGDKAAYNIVESEIRALARTLVQLVQDDPPKTAWLYGGVFEHNEWTIPLFESEIQKALPEVCASLIPYSPAIGAAIYAIKRKKGLNASVIQEIKNTYKEWTF